jgi:alanine racemase
MSNGRVVVNLAALVHNYARLAETALPGSCAAVVKANAYGLGVDQVATRLFEAGCRHFFVATLEEALELRSLLPEPELFVLNGTQGAGNEKFVSANLTPVLNTRAELRTWGRAGPACVHIDSGMSRLGLSPGDVDAIRLEAGRLPKVDVRYVMTHLACADEPDHPLNRKQIEIFDAARSLWPKAQTSIGNSAGTLLAEDYRSDLARPGIALYGGNPFRKAPQPMEPVVTVQARLLQLRDIRPGATVGYGATFAAAEATRIGTVAIGYADGYMRSLSNCGIAEVAGQRVPVVGRVSMDLITVDVTSVPRDSLTEGDWITLIGGSISLEEVATLAGTINYELLTALGHRLDRVYVD